MMLHRAGNQRSTARLVALALATPLIVLVAVRVWVRHGNCWTMLAWGIEIGSHPASASNLNHSEESEDVWLHSGCVAADKASLSVNVSNSTLSPRVAFLSKTTTSTTNNGIPRILHQSYSSNTVPAAVYPLIQSWNIGRSHSTSSEHNATTAAAAWKHVWWTDDDLTWLVDTHYPQYSRAWKNLPHGIMRADVARYFLLHKYGGVYADMDIQYTGTHGALEDWLGRQEHHHAFVFHNCDDNSFLASSPNATFWPLVFVEWTTAAARRRLVRRVNDISGIDMLKRVCQRRPPELTVGPGMEHLSHHHNTNMWRWKTKRDDIVRVLDGLLFAVIVVFFVAIAGVVKCDRLSKGRDEWFLLYSFVLSGEYANRKRQVPSKDRAI